MSATPDTSRRKRPARWWQRLILASAPDVLGLLVEQGRVSLEAVSAFERWSRGGDGELIQRIRDLEHEADEVRRALTGALREALATPIDQEDLYVLSERCDRVVNAVKNLVRQAEVLEWRPDSFAAEMACAVREAMERILDGFNQLGHDPEAAGAAADAATKASRAVEKAYRSAMGELMAARDLASALAGLEMYRWYARTGELVAGAADRLWYAVLSEP
ncbi:MAG TPA: DUF47 family protein [Actinomycetota bacterium]|nr:DUF47 family protein [Actinomycetota bacterium]